MFHRVILLSGRLQRLRPRRGLHSAPRVNAGVPPGSKSPLYNRRIKTAKIYRHFYKNIKIRHKKGEAGLSASRGGLCFTDFPKSGSSGSGGGASTAGRQLRPWPQWESARLQNPAVSVILPSHIFRFPPGADPFDDPADEEQQHGKSACDHPEEDDREPRARENPGEEAQDQQREHQ